MLRERQELPLIATRSIRKMHADWCARVHFFIYDRAVRLIFIHVRGQDCLVRGLFNVHQTQFFPPQLESQCRKKTPPKNLQLTLKVITVWYQSNFYIWFFPHMWKFQASNLVPSWEWHSSSWMSSPVEQPDPSTFQTPSSASQHRLDLCFPKRGSPGKVTRYKPHFLSWSVEN